MNVHRATCIIREIHPLDPQPHRHSMLVPTVCVPRVTRGSLGKYWSRDWFRSNFSLTQGQQAANPGVHMLSMTHSGVRQRNLMTHAQCPLPVYYSQVSLIISYVWCPYGPRRILKCVYNKAYPNLSSYISCCNGGLECARISLVHFAVTGFSSPANSNGTIRYFVV